MKYKQFDVVVLNNENRATILGINNNSYNAEIVDIEGNRIEIKLITDDEVKGFSNKIVEHIMTFSKTDIPRVKSKFDPILFKIS